MKKLFSVFILAFSLVAFNCMFTSCDKDDNDEYFAGESEEDYKPNVYYIESSWDFSKVEGLSAQEKKDYTKQFEDAVNGSKTFNTRADAVAAFDQTIADLRKIDAPEGLKAVVTLKRATAIIKRANLQW